MKLVRLLPALFGLAVALAVSPASAVPTPIVAGSLPVLLTPNTTYVSGDIFTFSSFTDTYNFKYSPPPAFGALSVITNIGGGISPFTVDWTRDGAGGSLIGGAAAIGAGGLTLALPLIIGDIYHLTLTGTVADFGDYTLTVTTGNAVPLPGALLLFGSIVAGGAGFMRLRQAKTAKAVTAS